MATEQRISTTHRALTLVALAALLASLGPPWRSVAASHPLAGVLVGSLYAVLLALLVAGLCVRGRRALTRVDAGGLAAAIALAVVTSGHALQGRTVYSVDEGALTHDAARLIADGHSPYGVNFPVTSGFTSLFDGRYPSHFGYPPLAPMIGALVSRVLPFASETSTACLLGLVASGVLTFALVPVTLRPLAVLSVFVVTPLMSVSPLGYPLVITTPFLILAVWQWPSIGAGGRLTRRHVLQAVALGCAAAGQQIVWFLIPFLLVALWRVRRGELGSAAAAAVVGRLAGVGAVTFLVLNAPFVIASPHAWFEGVTDPLRQHGFFSGAGLANLSLRVLPGSGALGFYSLAAIALFATLLAAVALFPARLGPAALLLPYAIFYVSVRSIGFYYQASLPAVFVALATAGPAAFAAARPVRFGRGKAVPVFAWALPAAGAVVTVALLAVAAFTPSPLRLSVEATGVRPAVGRGMTESFLRVTVTNTSGHAVSPHFLTDRGAKISLFWRILDGPATLGAHERGTYLLRSARKQGGYRMTKVWVTSDDPQTVQRAVIPRRVQNTLTPPD